MCEVVTNPPNAVNLPPYPQMEHNGTTKPGATNRMEQNTSEGQGSSTVEGEVPGPIDGSLQPADPDTPPGGSLETAGEWIVWVEGLGMDGWYPQHFTNHVSAKIKYDEYKELGNDTLLTLVYYGYQASQL